MNDQVHETYIKQLLEAHGQGEVTIAWQGGEPTLTGLDFYKRSLELIAQYKKSGQTILHSIQTNATRISDEWAAFFAENNFLVGVSIDGPKAMHDAYRTYKSGKGSFDRVIKGYETLKKHGTEINILCTMHAENASFPLEIYHFFRDELKADHIQFIPIVERNNDAEIPIANIKRKTTSASAKSLYKQQGSTVTKRSITAEQYGQFLVSIFDEWIKHDVGSVFVQSFDVALASWMGMHSLCVFSPTCGNALALEHNGDLYACDHYVEPDYLIGNILEKNMGEMVNSPEQRRFGRNKYDLLPNYCHQCDVKFACYGGCPKDRFIQTPTGDDGLNYLCVGYKKFFNHIKQPMSIMASLLRAGKAPSEVMNYVQE